MNKFLCNICNQGNSNKKWIPVSVSNLEEIIGRKIENKNLRKNIVYNLQFLQFIIEYTKQLYLTSVIYTLSCKVFVVITVSIIEGILFHEIKKRGVQKKSVWNFLKKIVSNESEILKGKKIRIEANFFEKLEEEKDEEMKFEQILNIAESKKILGEDHAVYEKMKGLKKLRNKIHLHDIKNESDNDYNNYDDTKIELAKDVLLYVLVNHFNISDEERENHFNFLNPKTSSEDYGII
jgi:hypothetical protein